MPGVFTVTLASIDPAPRNPALGMSFGMWDGTTCTDVLIAAGRGRRRPALTGTASIETDVCIRMWDPTPWDDGAVTLTYHCGHSSCT